MRGEGGGSGGYTVTFRNIKVEDPRPTLQHFKILMQGEITLITSHSQSHTFTAGLQPWSDPEEKRDPGDLFGILFQGYFDWIYDYFGYNTTY